MLEDQGSTGGCEWICAFVCTCVPFIEVWEEYRRFNRAVPVIWRRKKCEAAVGIVKVV